MVDTCKAVAVIVHCTVLYNLFVGLFHDLLLLLLKTAWYLSQAKCSSQTKVSENVMDNND